MDALKHQIGGMHYKSKTIQPIEYCLANDLNFCEGCVVKYVTRWRDKGGVEDLMKAKHYLEFLIEDAEAQVRVVPKQAPMSLNDIALSQKIADEQEDYPSNF